MQITASGFLNPLRWGEDNKEFSLWLREAKAWKVATSGVTGLKDVHGLQLALHLPDGSEIRGQVFDTLDTEDMIGDDRWKKVIELIETYYSKDDNTSALTRGKTFVLYVKEKTKILNNISCIMRNIKSEWNALT